jgi:serine/threonine protein kinase
MNHSSRFDRNLLFVLTAADRGLISRDDAMAAMNALLSERSRTIGSILVEQAAMTADARDAFEGIVTRHVTEHGGNVGECLQALNGPTTQALLKSLSSIDDPELRASLVMAIGSKPTDVFVSRGDSSDGASEIGSAILSDDNAEAKKGPTRPDAQWTAGRFGVVREIGGDGMGLIYEAYDTAELGRRVAVKTVNEQKILDAFSLRHYREMLRQEGEINGNLEHPNIIPVYGLGATEEGKPYFAMRFVDQIDLRAAIRNFHAGLPLLHREDPGPRKPTEPDIAETDAQMPSATRQVRFDRLDGRRNLDFRELLERFTDVCDAIEYAHLRSVLHRDLKPGNVMLGEHGETLVIDWGLAKVRDAAEKTQPLTIPFATDGYDLRSQDDDIKGTLPYMSPESLMGANEKLNDTTDIYSLGVILYEILTGKRPHYDRIRDELSRISDIRERALRLLKEVRKGPPDLAAENPSIPRPLAAICRKAIAVEQHERYRSAESLAADVEAWLADEPVSAYLDKEKFGERAGRWMRKNRGATAAIAASLAFLAVGGAVFGAIQSNFNMKLRNSEEEAKRQRDIAQGRRIEVEQKSVENLEAAVRTAMSRGAWKEALSALDKLDALIAETRTPISVTKRIDLKLDRLAAMDGLNPGPEALSLLQELESELASSPERFDSRRRGRIYVNKGNLLYESLKPGEVSPYVLALKEPDLALSDKYYAQAMLEPDPGKALQLLKMTLAENPFDIRAVSVFSLLSILRGNVEEAIDRIRFSRSLLPDDANLFLVEIILKLCFYDDTMTENERIRIRNDFRAQAPLIISSLDFMSDARRLDVNMIRTLGLTNSWFLYAQKNRTSDGQRSGLLNAVVSNPPAVFLPLGELFRNLLNTPDFIFGFGLNPAQKSLEDSIRAAIGVLRWRLKIPTKNRAQRIADYRKAIRIYPIMEFSLILAIEQLDADQIREAAETIANMPDNRLIRYSYADPMILALGALSTKIDSQNAKALKSLPQGDPFRSVVDEQTVEHGRKALRKLLHRSKEISSFENNIIFGFASNIGDFELAANFFETSLRLFPGPLDQAKKGAVRYFRAMSDPYAAVEFLRVPGGGLRTDMWSVIWMRIHREHPELVRIHPFLDEMPENPFMPWNAEHPLPLTLDLISTTTLRPGQ